MTDKEEIIIDGVNVGQCKYLNTFTDCEGYHYYCDLADDIKNEYCEHYKNCYFKQLQHKEQECDKLKTQIETYSNMLEGCRCKIFRKEQECERYKKALNEIEQHCNEQNLKYDTTACEILTIIDKAKEQ